MFFHQRIFPSFHLLNGKKEISSSVEFNQILWINLIAVKNDINLWIGHVVHAAVVKVSEAGVLGGGSAVHGMAHRVLADEYSGQEHGLKMRLAGKYRRRESVSL